MFAVFSACTFKNRQKDITACTFINRQVFSFMSIIWIICSECVFLLEKVPSERVMLYVNLDNAYYFSRTRRKRSSLSLSPLSLSLCLSVSLSLPYPFSLCSFTPEMKFEYDLQKEADFPSLNIASGECLVSRAGYAASAAPREFLAYHHPQLHERVNALCNINTT
jgi:hypothetical protein